MKKLESLPQSEEIVDASNLILGRMASYVAKKALEGNRMVHPRKPDGYVRRVIRGMLPWKKPSGKQAFHRVKVYIGTPDEYRDRPGETIEGAESSKLRVPYITVARLSEEIGGFVSE